MVEELITKLESLDTVERRGLALDAEVLTALGFGVRRIPMDSDIYWGRPDLEKFLTQEEEQPTKNVEYAVALAERLFGHCFWVSGCLATINGVDDYHAMLSTETYGDSASSARTAALAMTINVLRLHAEKERLLSQPLNEDGRVTLVEIPHDGN